MSCDQFYNQTVLLLPYEADTADHSSHSNAMTNTNAALSSGQAKFGAVSMKITSGGGAAGITTPDQSYFDFSTTDWCFEGWFFWEGGTLESLQTLFKYNFTSLYPFQLTISPSGVVAANGADGAGTTVYSFATPNATFTVNTWHMIVLQRQGANINLWVDGVLYATATYSGVLGNNNGAMIVASANPTVGNWYLDMVRLSRVARYPAGVNFTPPTAPFDAVQCDTAPTCDPYWNNVSLLLTCDGTNGSTSFPDSSQAANTVSATGVTVSTTTPKFGTGAAQFPGFDGFQHTLVTPIVSGGPLDIFGAGAGDFTVEGWAKLDSNDGGFAKILLDYGGYVGVHGFVVTIDAPNFRPTISVQGLTGWSAFNYFGSPSPITVGQYFHYAVVRAGTVVTLYIDGVATGYITGASSGAFGQANLTYGWTLGSGSNSTTWHGQLDEMRITKGVARYLTDFTPDTAAFPSVACTPYFPPVLSGSINTPLLHANLAWTSAVPNTGYSGPPPSYLVYRDAALIATLNNSPTEILAYVDTVPGAGTYTYTVAAGSTVASNVSLLLHMDGTNGSTSFPDSSFNGLTVTANGAGQVSTANPKFGTGAYQGAASSSLTVPIVAAGPLDIINGGDFTVEGWAYWDGTLPGGQQIIFDFGQAGGYTDFFRLSISSGGNFTTQGFGALSLWQAATNNAGIAANTWFHYAVVRQGAQGTLYINGVGVAAPSANWTGTASLDLMRLGASYLSIFQDTWWLGQFDEYRVTKGTAVYTANFTPPTAPFPAPSGTASPISDPSNPYVAVFGTPPVTTTVPDLTNVSVPTATLELTAVNLVLGSPIAYESDVLTIAGNILRQFPAPGSVVVVGTSVSVVVSTGRAGIFVPPIIGLTIADADTSIVHVGLVTGTVTFAPSLLYPAGVVIAQNPSRDTPVGYGTIVSYIVSSGPPLPDGGFDFEATVISQYANSPTLLQLVKSINGYIDQSVNFANFYNFVWNVDTAQGFGLDVWGKIVNVSRLLQIPTAARYVGFQDGTGPGIGTDVEPFSQDGTWYTPLSAVEGYLLEDAPYRQLILTKALANIVNTTVPAFNQLLQNLFPGRGNPYVRTSGVMAMEFVFDFALTPIELAILEQSGAVPVPPGVSFTITVP